MTRQYRVTWVVEIESDSKAGAVESASDVLATTNVKPFVERVDAPKLTKPQREMIRTYLLGQFPWLGIGGEDMISGADVVQQLSDCYEALGTDS